MTDEEPQPEEKPKHGIGERIREHLQAAEVAAEESAGYGWVTEAVEAVEAAVNPKHELGPQKHDDEHEEPEVPSDEKAPSGEPGDTASQG